jgi:hypothetical protein
MFMPCTETGESLKVAALSHMRTNGAQHPFRLHTSTLRCYGTTPASNTQFFQTQHRSNRQTLLYLTAIGCHWTVGPFILIMQPSQWQQVTTDICQIKCGQLPGGQPLLSHWRRRDWDWWVEAKSLIWIRHWASRTRRWKATETWK